MLGLVTSRARSDLLEHSSHFLPVLLPREVARSIIYHFYFRPPVRPGDLLLCPRGILAPRRILRVTHYYTEDERGQRPPRTAAGSLAQHLQIVPNYRSWLGLEIRSQIRLVYKVTGVFLQVRFGSYAWPTPCTGHRLVGDRKYQPTVAICLVHGIARRLIRACLAL